MKYVIAAAVLLLATPVAADQQKAVFLNAKTGYVGSVLVKEGAKVQKSQMGACGKGCEVADYIRPGECMIVSISIPEAAWGYQYGPAEDVAKSRAKAKKYCESYGGSACKESKPICN